MATAGIAVLRSESSKQKVAMRITLRFYEESGSWWRSDMFRFILVNDRSPRSDAPLCLVLLQGHGELHQGDRYEVLLLQLRLFP